MTEDDHTRATPQAGLTPGVDSAEPRFTQGERAEAGIMWGTIPIYDKKTGGEGWIALAAGAHADNIERLLNQGDTRMAVGETDSVQAVLADLVRLKDGPRDDAYRTEKDSAWQRARDVLGRTETLAPHPDETDCTCTRDEVEGVEGIVRYDPRCPEHGERAVATATAAADLAMARQEQRR